MPTYSYACTACGHAFDIRQSFTDDSLTVCPECGEATPAQGDPPGRYRLQGLGLLQDRLAGLDQGRRIGRGCSGSGWLVGVV